MKFEYKKNGNMLVKTNYELFNKQTNYLGVGNVVANTQMSSFIRASYEVSYDYPNIPDAKIGQFQDFDLKPFIELNEWNKVSIKEFADENKGAILYWFFYYASKKRTTIGYLLTNKERDNYKFLYKDINRMKKHIFFEYLLPYFCNTNIEYDIDTVIADKKRLIEKYCKDYDSIASYNKKVLEKDISILENMKKNGKTTYSLPKKSDNHSFENKPLFREYLTSNNTRG
jgi:hypothetical protein